MSQYHQAIAEIVDLTEPGSKFEYAAIDEVASEHGEDPIYVANDVLRLRVAQFKGVSK